MNEKNAAETAEKFPLWEQEFYKVSDIMKILRISRSTAYKYIREKDFPKILIGSSYRIPKKEFEEWYKKKMNAEYK